MGRASLSIRGQLGLTARQPRPSQPPGGGGNPHRQGSDQDPCDDVLSMVHMRRHPGDPDQDARREQHGPQPLAVGRDQEGNCRSQCGVVGGVQQAGTVARVAPRAGSGRPALASPPPVRLRLPRLDIDAQVLPVSVGADGLLGVPDNPRQLGWWSGGDRPGMPSGSVVIDGHVDSAALGLGALFRLSEARPGDAVFAHQRGRMVHRLHGGSPS